MYYEINVAEGGRHLFATAERSLTTKPEAVKLARRFVKLFPDASVTLTYYPQGGEQIEFDKVRDETSLHITLGATVLVALSLDDDVMRGERKLEIDPEASSSRSTMLWGSAEAIAIVLDDVLSRSKRDSGWDQPSIWMYACRNSFPKLVKQIEKQGRSVRVVGERVEIE